MYAIIRASGHQHKVQKGETLVLDRLPGNAGERVEFKDVLMVGKEDGVLVGTPILATAKVTAEIIEHRKDKKVLVFKYKRRKNYKRTRGHRQAQTLVTIKDITL